MPVRLSGRAFSISRLFSKGNFGKLKGVFKRQQAMTANMKERVEKSCAERCSPEFFYSDETAGKIQAGIDSFRRGEGRPAAAVFAELRKKHGL